MSKEELIGRNDFNMADEIAGLIPELPGIDSTAVFDLDRQTGSFGLYSSDDKQTGLPEITGSIEINGTTASLSEFTFHSLCSRNVGGAEIYQITFVHRRENIRWHWLIGVRDRDVLIGASLENTGPDVLAISGWRLLQSKSAAETPALTRHPAETRFFRWNSWNMGVEQLADGQRAHESENLLHLYDPIDRQVLFCGFLTLSRMRVRHEIRIDQNNRGIEYRAGCLFGEYALEPAGIFNSELAVISFHRDPYAVLENWAEQVAGIYRPQVRDLPPVGWCGGSWASARSAGVDQWEQYAMQNAKAIRRRLKGFDVRYIWTSQANLKDYIPGNWLQVNKQEIPSGLRRFFRRMMNLDFIPGLWVSPFWFFGEATGILKENRDNLLKDKTGAPICTEDVWGWQYDDDRRWYHMHLYFLDGSHPKTIDYIRRLFAYYREIGVRYYMLDFLGIVDGSQLHDRRKTPYQAGYDILREIREASGADTHIQTAVSSSPGFAGIINSARIGRDFGEGRPLEGGSLSDWRNATHVLHDLHYANTKYFLQNIAASYFTHQKLYMNDLNLMTVNKPYPVEHARMVATLFGLNGGSPLMLGDDIVQLDEERLRLIKLCLPRTRHSARPVDLFERVQPDDYSRILKLEIKTAWDSYVLVGVFNIDDQACRITLDFARLGLQADEKYVVYDFWNEAYCGIFRKSYPVEVPADSCKLYRLAKERPYPWLMGTDLHIQQGFTEISGMRWNEENGCLSGSVTRPVGERGNLFILMPRNFQLLNTGGISLVKELLDFHVILRLPLHFTADTLHFELKFDHWRLNMLAPKGLLPYATKEEWLAYMRDHYHKEETRVFE